jgi:putative FmdB family regulatory protein
MPIFDFQCRKCGHRFEELVRGDATPECPKCRSVATERQFPLQVAVVTPKSQARTTAIARQRAKSIQRDVKAADVESLRKHIKEDRGE